MNVYSSGKAKNLGFLFHFSESVAKMPISLLSITTDISTNIKDFHFTTKSTEKFKPFSVSKGIYDVSINI